MRGFYLQKWLIMKIHLCPNIHLNVVFLWFSAVYEWRIQLLPSPIFIILWNNVRIKETAIKPNYLHISPKFFFFFLQCLDTQSRTKREKKWKDLLHTGDRYKLPNLIWKGRQGWAKWEIRYREQSPSVIPETWLDYIGVVNVVPRLNAMLPQVKKKKKKTKKWNTTKKVLTNKKTSLNKK